MTVDAHFSATYAEARARLRSACDDRGLTVRSYVNEAEVGPDGGPLAVDVTGWHADRDRLLVVSSATHGIEGYCGSGCQTALLRSDLGLPPSVGLVLVHAVNPHGFAHGRRVTEGNVDLNRNFVDFACPPPNPAYEALHAHLVPDDFDGPSRARADAALEAFVAERGPATFQAAVSGGQYTHADGLFYGGTEPVWSHRTLRRIVADWLSHAGRITVVDIHTGLGPRGVGELLFDGASAVELGRARRWFGEVTCPGADDSVSAALSGISAVAYEDVGGAELTRVTLEFGTEDVRAVFEALRADNWLHARGRTGAVSPEDAATIRAQIRRAFFCEDADWAAAVWSRCQSVVRSAFSGLAEA